MNDSTNRVAVIGPKEITQIFGVCGFDIFPELTDEIANNYALILVTEGAEQDPKWAKQPYPIVMEVKWQTMDK